MVYNDLVKAWAGHGLAFHLRWMFPKNSLNRGIPMPKLGLHLIYKTRNNGAKIRFRELI